MEALQDDALAAEHKVHGAHGAQVLGVDGLQGIELLDVGVLAGVHSLGSQGSSYQGAVQRDSKYTCLLVVEEVEVVQGAQGGLLLLPELLHHRLQDLFVGLLEHGQELAVGCNISVIELQGSMRSGGLLVAT